MDDQYGQNYEDAHDDEDDNDEDDNDEDEHDDEDDNDDCLTVRALQGYPYLSKESSQAESDLH